MDDNLRINFWVFQTPFFEVVNELKRQFSSQSVFVNVFEEIQNRMKETPLDKKLQHQILVDLQRTKHPLTDEAISPELTKQLFQILQAIAFVLPEIGYC